jgi:Raf kinase inhibitor-like YbhB/YbcL family protein
MPNSVAAPARTRPSRAPRTLRARVGALLAVAALALPTSVQAQAPARIVVQSPAMTTGQMMARDFSPDGRNVSPPLTWGPLPAGTRQLVVICQDHGAGNPPPWVHWLVYNIPATARGLPEGMPIDRADPMPAGLEGATHGNNSWNLAMYRGPAPPAGTVHDYDFTVLALNAELNLPSGLTRAEVLEAVAGHVIGQGNMVPTYTRQPADQMFE